MSEFSSFAVDVGNTRIKVGLFSGLELREVHFFEEAFDVFHFLEKGNLPIPGIVSDVRGALEGHNWKLPVRVLRPMPSLPFESIYSTPETLGADRISAIKGAEVLYPGQAKLIVDAGSCVTYDRVDAAGKHWGGNISPGWDMRLKALHTFTGKLPMVSAGFSSNGFGTSTVDAMQKGVYQGLKAEIDTYFSQFREGHPEGIILLTGGNGRIFESITQSFIFAVPNLVLIGLNALFYQYEA
jgi:type III pantothenate kinase